MTWLRIEDDMLDHEKWRRALRDGGADALLVWMRLSSWCARRLTDGRVPSDMVAEIACLKRSKSRTRALQALVEHGLCTRHVDGAIVINGYLERNPSKADTIAERERRAQAQRDYALRRKLTGQRPVELPDPDPVALRPPDDVPSRPVPSRPVPEPVEDAREARPKRQRTKLPEDLQPNEATLQHARKHGVDWALEEERFKDHHRSKATLSADWQASMRTWIGNAPKFAPTQQRTATKGGPQPWMFEELERARREEAAE